MSIVKGKEMKTIAIGAVAAIAAATLVSGGISQTVRAAEVGKTQVVPTSYSVPYSGAAYSNVPADYVKKEYKVKFVGQDQSTVNDLKGEEAAELASQNLWRIFHAELSGQTLEVTYHPISTTNLRATWAVHIKINDTLSYDFALDAVTGENQLVAKRIYHKADIREGMDKTLLKDSQKYQALAKAATEKYQFVSGKVTSVEYISQGFQKNEIGAKNSDITLQVKSDKGEAAQLTFSRYNKELLSVEYNGWLQEAESYQKWIEQEETNQMTNILITDEVIKEVQEKGSPIEIKE
ncbi:hypothetical protein J2Z22_000817 [Paenibacillus forsythiae]|uniref:Uncharacterized protein n=1 Tax=Paenibacillus forsythiae TaxID=365616 RepID=A0ABU3H3K2_9BACL|nr:hypothetical protein [Paenibacillus forsythiae]MDT3425301.1 hypothetical protein [Paenibacillus forsythiae]